MRKATSRATAFSWHFVMLRQRIWVAGGSSWLTCSPEGAFADVCLGLVSPTVIFVINCHWIGSTQGWLLQTTGVTGQQVQDVSQAILALSPSELGPGLGKGARETVTGELRVEVRRPGRPLSSLI